MKLRNDKLKRLLIFTLACVLVLGLSSPAFSAAYAGDEPAPVSADAGNDGTPPEGGGTTTDGGGTTTEDQNTDQNADPKDKENPSSEEKETDLDSDEEEDELDLEDEGLFNDMFGGVNTAALFALFGEEIEYYEGTDIIAVDMQNAGFHCNTFGGNGRVWIDSKGFHRNCGVCAGSETYTYGIYYFKCLNPEDEEENKVWELIGRHDEVNGKPYIGNENWLIAPVNFVCTGSKKGVQCHSNYWISYSNMSGFVVDPLTGVISGENIQLNHGEPGDLPEDGEWTPAALKTAEGKNMTAGQFEFALYSSDEFGNYNETNDLLDTATNGPGNSSAAVEFDTIYYERAGTYYYVIKETSLNEKGWTVDTGYYLIRVVVTLGDTERGKEYIPVVTYGDKASKNEDGSFNNWLSFNAASISFKNIFTPAKWKPLATKTAEGKDMSRGQFEFTLFRANADGTYAPGDVVRTAKNRIAGESSIVLFDSIRYNEEGTFYYVLKETSPNKDGWKVDTKEYLIKVEVEDNDGVLEATATYQEGDEWLDYDVKAITFNNVFKPAKWWPVARKTTEGKDMLRGQFEFNLYISDENGDYNEADEPIDTASNRRAGDNSIVVFEPIFFEEAGLYYIILEEVIGDIPGWEYDPTVFLLVVEVKENDKGKLVAEAEVYIKDESADSGWSFYEENNIATFTNTYEAIGKWRPGVLKNVELGDDTDVTTLPLTWSFEFGLYDYRPLLDDEGNIIGGSIVMSGTPEIRTADELNPLALFNEIDLSKFELKDGEAEFFRLVKEIDTDGDGWFTDTTEYLLRVKITDDGDGNLVPTVTVYIWVEADEEAGIDEGYWEEYLEPTAYFRDDEGDWVPCEEDDILEASILPFTNIYNPVIGVEVSKDTITLTSAGYSSSYLEIDEEDVENVGIEQIVYETHFRSTSNVSLDSFKVVDPLEAVNAGDIELVQIWTPAVFGLLLDENTGEEYILEEGRCYLVKYQTGTPDLDPDSDAWITWERVTADGNPSSAPVPAGISALMFDFGPVEPGFTSLHGTVPLLNDAGVDTANAASANTVTAGLSALFAPIKAYADITPVSNLNWNDNPLSAGFAGYGLPITLVAVAARPLTSADNINGSIYVTGTRAGLTANAQDTVLTRNLAPLPAGAEGSVDKITYLDGNVVIPLSRSARTGDTMVLEIPIIAMVGALAGIMLLVAYLRKNRRKACAETGTDQGGSVKKTYKKMRMFSLLLVGLIACAAFIPAPVSAATAPEGRQYYYTVTGGFTQAQFEQWKIELATRPVDPIPMSVLDQIVPAEKADVRVEQLIKVMAETDSNDVLQLDMKLNFDVQAQNTPIVPSIGTKETKIGDKYYIKNSERLVREVPNGGIEFIRGTIVDGELVEAPATDRPVLTETYVATVVYRAIELVDGYAGFTTTIGDFSIITTIVEYFTAAAAAAAGTTPPPVITITPEETPLAPAPTIADQDVPLAAPSDSNAGSEATTIPAERVPLANTSASWSLLSLIFVAIGLAFALISFIAAQVRRDEKPSVRVLVLRILAIAVAAVTLLTWLLIDTFTGYMFFVNNNTLAVGILFAATIVVSMISNAFAKKSEDSDELADA